MIVPVLHVCVEVGCVELRSGLGLFHLLDHKTHFGSSIPSDGITSLFVFLSERVNRHWKSFRIIKFQFLYQE